MQRMTMMAEVVVVLTAVAILVTVAVMAVVMVVITAVAILVAVAVIKVVMEGVMTAVKRTKMHLTFLVTSYNM